MGDLVGWVLAAMGTGVMIAATVPVMRHIRLVRREWNRDDNEPGTDAMHWSPRMRAGRG
jgi:hypothetical protein